MKGDFSRKTFDRQHHFSRVLMQQGRVLLDADWNEQTSILLHYLRTLASDLIGPHGGPDGPDGAPGGFEIVCEGARKCDFIIGRGHYYVGGILCDNVPPRRCRPAPPEEPLRYTDQPDYPDAPALESGSTYFVYLDVWERHLTHLQVEHIREVALGGPDTATRAKIVCQVKVADISKDEDERSCAELLDDLRRTDGPCLRARARVAAVSDDPCVIPPEARYRGVENQLYRVEIHDGGTAANDDDKPSATFKWSRDNGSIVFAIRSLQGSLATLESLGPDARRGLAEGDWVEVVDDVSALKGEPGPVLMVDAVDPVSAQVTLSVPDGTELPTYDENSEAHPLLRRWDQGADAPVVEDEWLTLEDGVQIRFEPDGVYRTGDYWFIPARTATGDVSWPTEPDEDGQPRPRALPPDGIEHRYAPLARIAVDAAGDVTCEDDCRCTFDPLCTAAEASEERQLRELRRVRHLGVRRARILFDAGRETPAAVAAMDVEEIRRRLDVSEGVAREIQESARKIAR